MHRPGLLLLLGLTLPASLPAAPATVPASAPAPAGPSRAQLLEQYCSDCHNTTDWAGSLAFDTLNPDRVGESPQEWEKVVRKLRGGLMPPPGKKRPEQSLINRFASALERDLDANAAAHPILGHVSPHRLNRTEYANAVWDLLRVHVDTEALLPKDVATEGFDNIAEVLKVSPSYMDQYLAAADLVTTQAVGDPNAAPESAVYRVPETANQAAYVPGLPFGTRGGILIHHHFPVDGDYDFSITGLAGSTYIWGLDYPETVVITIDGLQVFEGHLGGDKDLKDADQRMANAVKEINARFQKIRRHVTAGPHDIGVALVAKSAAESDEILQDFDPAAGVARLARVASVEIAGPYAAGQVSETASRRALFICHPANAAQEAPCAQSILSTVARKAFRRPVDAHDLEGPMAFYARGRAAGGFDKGIQYGLMAILASPKFLYRVEAPPGPSGLLSSEELASRLSFFLWSRPPDEALLAAAASGALQQPQELERQVQRMLKDPAAHSLVTSFAFQWLGVRGLDLVNPDPSIFPEFDEDLRAAFVRELEDFIGSIFQEDHSILELLTGEYTFVNGRLARHYGIDQVRGPRFQKVHLTDSTRFGLLGKGAILMTTSYANRTSPVVRGAWILERLLGSPPSPPPPNVEAFPENKAGARALTVRQRLEMHRAQPSCNACHGVMDPLGLALENFSAIGGYHTLDPDSRAVIDASGRLVDGTPLKGPDDLRKALASHPEQFARTFTEKLLTFALGRTLAWYDMPTVRQIVRDAEGSQYRFSALVLGVVKSDAFRRTAGARPLQARDTGGLAP